MDNILDFENKTSTVKTIQDILQESIVSQEKLYLWQGNICTLQVDAIVNAANEYMLGCFTPNHPCIDNAIHSAAGPRLRAQCRQLMSKQGHMEQTGKAKITLAYKLPCKYVIHTVGPICSLGAPLQPEYLSSCYTECLNLAKQNNVRSIAFCCISTGVFGYPNKPAAITALRTVKQWLSVPENNMSIDFIIFNVYKNKDREIYRALLNNPHTDEPELKEIEKGQ